MIFISVDLPAPFLPVRPMRSCLVMREGDLVQEDEAAEEQGYVVYGDHLAGFF